MPRRMTPSQVALEFIKFGKDPEEAFEKKVVNSEIGYGLFTKKAVCRGDFLVEYRGLLRDVKEIGDDDTYVFEFQDKKFSSLCIDASIDDGSLGRLINDGWGGKENCKAKTVISEGRPHIAFFAIKDIPPKTELRYDYGVTDYWWRQIMY
ncbi:N-lysine methyltransferase KMT5A-like [Tubulanus polymorphus]|uniref:N-lysine methyltransferase KMT5A-like n=1 Tax=Tubulanus polymorphus TaxID=672921 RepID=UPI003DA55E54